MLNETQPGNYSSRNLRCAYFALLEQTFISYSDVTCFTFSTGATDLQIPLKEAENISHFADFDSWKEQFSLFLPFFLEIYSMDLTIRVDFYQLVFIQMEISLQRQLKLKLLTSA